MPDQSNADRAEGLRVLAGGAAIAAAAVAAYRNSFSSPFVFLDIPAIAGNPTIRRLWPVWRVLVPPSAGGVTVGGRPLVNLSLAVNYAVSGTQVWSYHALNLLVHVLAGLALFGVVRRTAGLVRRDGPDATALGFLAAIVWTLHPIQTESVTYVIQRAESLMGLFYLLTLYAFIRGAGAEGGRAAPRWFGLCWLACLCGMATKEVMVSAPLIVLLYDRTFLGGTFRSAWSRHWRVHAALFSTWLPLAALVAGTGGSRGGTSGFGLGLPWWRYVLTQFPALARYLGLAAWPAGLDFYYPVRWIHSAGEVVPAIALILPLFVLSAAGLWRRRWWGLAGFWFFAILAPTSLVPGMSQTVAEHRMYLALAPVVILGVAGVFRLSGLVSLRGKGATAAVLAGGLVLSAVLGRATARRNEVYRSERALWSDTAAKSPGSPYVQNNLGVILAGEGSGAEAIGRFERALAAAPDYAEARGNLGLALAGCGRFGEAIAQYREALRLKPGFAEAEANLGVALSASGRPAEALGHFRSAVRLAPGYAEGHNDLAVALAQAGRLPEAIAEYGIVLRLKPDSAETHYNLGNALAFAGRTAEAAVQYGEAVRLKPDNVEARANLGAVLAKSGRLSEAVEQYERALDRAPDDPDIHYNLGLALRALGRTGEADSQMAEASRLRASLPAAR